MCARAQSPIEAAARRSESTSRWTYLMVVDAMNSSVRKTYLKLDFISRMFKEVDKSKADKPACVEIVTKNYYDETSVVG